MVIHFLRPLLTLASMAVLVSLHAQIQFGPPRPISQNLHDVRSIIFAEIDGTPGAEIVIGSWGQGDVLALRVDGVPGSEHLRLLGGSYDRKAFTAADVDGDGNADLVTGNITGNGNDYCLAIHYNDGSGGFADFECVIAGLRHVQHVLVADLTDGAYMDIAVTTNDRVQVYQRMTSGAWTQVWSTSYTHLAKPIAADVNSDGLPELILSGVTHEASLVEVYDLRSPEPAIATTSVEQEWPYGAHQLHAVDVDQDGALDLVQTVDSLFPQNSLRVWRNQGHGSFDAQPLLPFGTSTSGFRLTAGDPDNGFSFRSIGLYQGTLLPSMTLGPVELLLNTPDHLNEWRLSRDGSGTEELLLIDADQLLKASRVDGDNAFQVTDTMLTWLGQQPQATIPYASGPLATIVGGGTPPDLHLIDPMLDGSRAINDRIRLLDASRGAYSRYAPILISVDLDGDGDEDLLGAVNSGTHPQAGDIFMVENLGTGHVFHALAADLVPRPAGFEYFDVTRLELFDVDDDGLDDLVIAGSWVDPRAGGNRMAADRIYRRSAPFSAAPYTAPRAPAAYLHAADLNGDGNKDLISIEGNPPMFIVHRNDGGGAFTPCHHNRRR